MYTLVWVPYPLCLCVTMTTSVCVPTGDSRVNVYPGLGALHTIFMRYHNYVAEELAASHTDYDDETLFQEARKIVIAVIQSITYNGNYSQKPPSPLKDNTVICISISSCRCHYFLFKPQILLSMERERNIGDAVWNTDMLSPTLV